MHSPARSEPLPPGVLDPDQPVFATCWPPASGFRSGMSAEDAGASLSDGVADPKIILSDPRSRYPDFRIQEANYLWNRIHKKVLSNRYLSNLLKYIK